VTAYQFDVLTWDEAGEVAKASEHPCSRCGEIRTPFQWCATCHRAGYYVGREHLGSDQ
jgi:hypothetical protein